jgi:hypothetical protein
MGGWGSGRWGSCRPRTTTGACIRIDLATITGNTTCVFMSAYSEACGRIGVRIVPDFKLGLAKISASTKGSSICRSVQITITRPNYGGQRHWFVCPRCRHRRRVLYLTLGLTLGCQGCLELAYLTQRMNRYWRLNHRLDAVWLRLGGREDTKPRYWPRRPKWRRRETQRRLRDRWLDLNAQIWQEGTAALARLLPHP